MTRSLKAQLAQKAEDNTQRHREANYRDDFDAGRQHTKIPLEKIDPNPYQPRTSLSEADIRELATSISSLGLLQPVSVRVIGDRYQLIAGERRLRAHRVLGKPTIEAIVLGVDEATSATLALAENIEREDLSDFEVGEGIRRVEEQFPGRTKLAESLGIQRSDLYRYFSYSKLPEFIRECLVIQPKLLSRTAASDIVKALKDAGSDERVQQRLRKAWEQLEAGKLDQTKIAGVIARPETGPSTSADKPTHIMKNGTKVGTFSRTQDKFVMKLTSSALSNEQVEKIQRFVVELFN
ncbi:Chromosome (plasmid) partitioning protein ParB/ Stage 0 sporulation protein J [Candidatus Paraburkholderia kirkii UZHbot1]|uniref:Chromosome (Plasmid) partitioning protein ParB/ Stage 0 sporulation protein J n=1 Tax=Candidatus Paraburkholderia kirkii UZHbot1 TaxID=1055526 RepID=G4MBL1_9BURK|nr:Chromosome (plasmid) partitioning protein ParB/ Stage 0 sporulation protein J [Candidatus Paraburkholderia kirkii UZHbot1]